MSNEIAGSNDYINWLGEIKNKIHSARQRAILKVNHELLGLYWSIGKALATKEPDWGDKFIDNLARDLKVEFPDEKGFSKTNLKYMRRWYNQYSSTFEIGQQVVDQLGNNAEMQLVQQVVAQLPNELSQQAADQIVFGLIYNIPWGHHVLILTKTNSPEEAYFYIVETIRNNWSRSVLQLQIEGQQFEKQGNKINNFDLTLPDAKKDLVRETLKSEYNLDFLGLEADVQEKELEKALTLHIRKFLIALGKGFAYVGNQHNIRIADDDFFLDMLFFNINLNCFVIVELKIGDFKPEFAGKLNFYTNAVDEVAKLPHHNPTIGILLCKTPNTDVIKLSLKGVNSPLGIADYKLTKELKIGMPTKKELEQSLHTEITISKSPKEERLQKLKAIIDKAGKEEVRIEKNNEITYSIIEKNIFVILDKLISEAKDEIIPLFTSYSTTIWTNSRGFKNQEEALSAIKEQGVHHTTLIELRLEGFKKAGTKSFSSHSELEVDFSQFKYTLKNYRKDTVITEKLYHQKLSEKEMNKIVDDMIVQLIDDIVESANRNLGD